MSSDKLDKYFRDTLGNYESDVDAEAIWQAVKPERRRPVIWWFLFGAVLLGGLGLSIAKFWPSEEAALAHENKQKQLEEVVAPAESSIETSPASATTAVIAGETLYQNELAGAEVATQGGTVPSAIETSIEAIQTPTNQTLSNTDIENVESSLVIEDEEESASTTAIVDEATQSSFPTSNLADRATALETVSYVEALRKERGTNWQTNPLAAGDYRLLPETALVDDLPAEQAYYRRSRPWAIQAQAGAHQLHRKLASNDSLGDDWIAIRTSSEQSLEAISAEVSLSYRLPSKWQVRAGLGWTMINTVSQNRQISTIEVEREGVQQIIIGPNQDSTFIIGTVTAYETIDQYRKTYNSFQHWDVPVLVGYNLDLGHWELLLEGGIRFNVQQSIEGQILNAEGNVASLEEAMVYRTSLGLTYQAGLGLSYAITAQLGLQLNTNFRYYPKSFSEDSASIDERYQLLGAQVGLRWRF